MAAAKTPETPKSNAKSKAKSKRGGARENAGRKPSPAKKIRSESVTEIVQTGGAAGDVLAALDDALRAVAPQCVVKLAQLANGGLVEVEETLEPAGLVTVRTLLRHEKGELAGEPMTDANGKAVIAEQLLYPDLPPETMVVTGRKTATLAPDYRALAYILDRVMGKPRQAVEVTGKDGGAIPIEIYLPDNGRDRREPEADPPAAQLPAPGDLPQHPG